MRKLIATPDDNRMFQKNPTQGKYNYDTLLNFASILIDLL